MKSSFSQEELESKLENYLNEFYYQKIVPLEKEIIRLGGRLDFEGNQDNINLSIGRFRPKDPFKEIKGNIHYWEDENSDYYRFFKSLFRCCLEKEWITIKTPLYDYEDTFTYWMWVFGSIDEYNKELNLVLKKEENMIVSPIEWFGQKNLCIYLVDCLIKEGYISSKRPNELIKEHFLPNSTVSTIANTKSKFKLKKSSKFSKIDDLLFELTSRLE